MSAAIGPAKTHEIPVGGHVNNENDPATVLTRAAATGSIKVVRELLDRGVDVNVRRADGFNPLLLAAFFGHRGVVGLLLQYGADVRITSRSETSAAMWATARGHLGISDLLTEAAKVEPAAPPEIANEPLAKVPTISVEEVVAPQTAREEAVEEPVEEQPAIEVSEIAQLPSEQVETTEAPLHSETKHVSADDTSTSEWFQENLQTTPEHSYATQSRAEDPEVTQLRRSVDTPEPIVQVEPKQPAADPTMHVEDESSFEPLHEIVDVPEYLPKIAVEAGPTFHPGTVFVERVTSTWTNLALTTIAVILLSGLVTFGALKFYRNKAKQRAAIAAAMISTPATTNSNPTITSTNPAPVSATSVEPQPAPSSAVVSDNQASLPSAAETISRGNQQTENVSENAVRSTPTDAFVQGAVSNSAYSVAHIRSISRGKRRGVLGAGSRQPQLSNQINAVPDHAEVAPPVNVPTATDQDRQVAQPSSPGISSPPRKTKVIQWP